MLEKPSKLKQMLHHPSNKKKTQNLTISSPVFQRSTNIYAMASPPATRTSFDINHPMIYNMYEPLSPPPPIPSPKKSRARSNTFHHHRVQPEPTPPMPDRQPPQKRPAKPQNTHCANPPPRRHSIYASIQSLHIIPEPLPAAPKTHHLHQPRKASLPTSPSTPALPSLTQDTRHASSHSLSKPSTEASVLLQHHQHQVSRAATAAILQPAPGPMPLEKSKSTPLKSSSKIKTYNVAGSPSNSSNKQRRTSRNPLRRSGTTSSPTRRKSSVSDLEKKKRQQELEDLISGKRASTLKLSLTPKNGLLN
ncbi:hypothetical protein DM01DRAFT_1384958 [Hesseltinella vesiculosa]|uniref:Uncharacterized protein n=1 Tax=Hesseltinella vesiculosa TaxID=101127 RepID=A0A1X2GB56_9FUNG|nr:hypothetical protein DM01DRAFT_1384958 [Hesseltinella vesiculosa]